MFKKQLPGDKLFYFTGASKLSLVLFSEGLKHFIDWSLSLPRIVTQLWHHYLQLHVLFQNSGNFTITFFLLWDFRLVANSNRFWVPGTHRNINIALWQLENKVLFPALCLIIEVTCGGRRRWCQAWMRLSMMPSPNNPASTVSVTTKDTLRKTQHWMEAHEKYYLPL